MTDPEDDLPDDIEVPQRAQRLEMTVGRVWREFRVSCPHEDLLRAWLEGALDPAQASYLAFHVEESECPYCGARLEALRAADREGAARGELDQVRERLLSSTMTFLRSRKA
ncbi:MAG: hypothetical protein R3F30_03710 [Planctomycetota bacterium]